MNWLVRVDDEYVSGVVLDAWGFAFECSRKQSEAIHFVEPDAARDVAAVHNRAMFFDGERAKVVRLVPRKPSGVL